MALEEREAAGSRRNMVRLLLAFGALGAAGALGFAFRAPRSKVSPSRSPWLRIDEGAKGLDDPGEPPVLWLALGTLSPSRRSAILDEIEAAMASVEARSNPLLVDLVEDDVVDVFRRSQGWLLPLCTAASALLAPSYEGPDGFRVEVLAANAPAEPAGVRAWRSEPEDARARRARFLAWPASRSVIVRTPSKEAARRVEDDLRNACTERDSAVALVLDRRLLDGGSPESRLDSVLARLEKARKRIETEDTLPLVPKAPVPGIPISSWVMLDDGELFVVPKLGALSPVPRFQSEIQKRLEGTACDLIAL